MQASHPQPDSPMLPGWLASLGRRAANSWRVLFSRGDFTALLLAVGVLLLPALTIAATVLTSGLGQLIPVTILSVVFGFLLARSHYNELVSLLMSTVYGIGFTGIITAMNMDGGSLLERLQSLTARMAAWLQVLFSGTRISDDNVIFVVFLSILFWFLGHNTAWHIFRLDRVWRVILPPALVIVVNAYYYTGDAPLGVYMAIFAVLALLLIARSTIEAREWEWYLNRISYPKRLRGQFLRWGAVLAILLVGIAWVLPNGAENENLQRVQEFLNNDPLEQLNELFNRLFASVETQGLATADYYGGSSLQLGGSIQLGEQVVMVVDAPPLQQPGMRYYWRSRTFGSYESGRWTPTAAVRLTVQNPSFQIVGEPTVPGARQPVEQAYDIVLSASRLVYSASQPAFVNQPVSIDMSYIDAAQTQMDVSVIRPLEVLRAGDRYTIRSSLFAADAPALRAAGTQYPAWVTETYLQLGSSVTQRTRDLALQIVVEAGAQTPYDQAKAIELWLRRNITYEEIIPGAPPGVDPVDWVLFEDPRGYCNYYASAMIVMLRSLNVPARMAAGFSQGEWDNAAQSYLVRERDAHTWVEVYFPGYGWVEFEPTAAQEQLDRPDVEMIAQGATATPPPTSTPAPTFTPTITPTNPPTSTPESGEGPAPVIPPTMTLTPTATATPEIAPVAPPPIEEQEVPQERQSVLATIFTLLLLVLLVLFLLLLLAAAVIFLVWWIEWRGLGGLSPVQRAYALLGRYAGYVGIHFPESDTPNERQRLLARRVPRAGKPVGVITEMYIEEEYGPEKPRSGKWGAVAHNAWQAARGAFFRKRIERFLPRRWR